MKFWKILSPKVLSTEERPDKLTSETQAKVKVTQVLFTDEEVRAYLGTLKPKYPVIPGRFAVGIVSEAGADCVKVCKNDRVYLHDVITCGKCEACANGKEDLCTDCTVAGVNGEGFLRDFVVAEEAQLSPLPASVSDDEALFIGAIALCEEIIERLNVHKGLHVAVIGANIVGNILSQLLIYHKAVPILIDADEKLLATAAACGIYYTVKADASLTENITRITGGRMASGSAYLSFSGMPADLPFAITKAGGSVVYAGLSFPETSAQLKLAMDKRLLLTAVTNDYSNISAAINLLVNKAINFAPFAFKKHPVSETEKLFADAAAGTEKGERTQVGIINLL